MSLNIKLEAFEGPMDLLLHLIEKNKLDIYYIPIAQITDQYLEYVRQMAVSDLDLASEFLVMAAELLMIKSKMLLPRPEEDEDEEVVMLKQELTAKLLELKMFKYIASELNGFGLEGQMRFYGTPSVPANIMRFRPKPDLEKLLSRFTSSDILRSYRDVCRRAAERIDPIRSRFNAIEAEKIDVNARVSDIKTLLHENKKLNFKKLLPEGSGKLSEIVTFLVLLELIKTGYVDAVQESPIDDIQITVLKDPESFGQSGEFFQ